MCAQLPGAVQKSARKRKHPYAQEYRALYRRSKADPPANYADYHAEQAVYRIVIATQDHSKNDAACQNQEY